MVKLLFTFVGFIFVFSNAIAQQRTYSECVQIAISIGHIQNVQDAKALTKSTLVVDDISDFPYYIFNDTINNKFAIVSGDKRMQPLLGYGKGIFGTKDIPDGLADMLRDYEYSYNYVQSLDLQDEEAFVENNNTYPISPLITSVWGQDIPFNNNTPRIGLYQRTASGCVATAMAQIMYYYKYPDKGKGSFSYITATHRIDIYEDFSQTTFDWNNMIDSYLGDFTVEQATAVAVLMKSCGTSVGMNYYSTSGAYSCDVPYAMINNFSYNPNIQYYLRKYFSIEEWNSIILEELACGRPILYSGTGYLDDGGHAFVLDGTDGNGLYHFNWGWEGLFDGYYAIDALTVGQNNFRLNHSMVCYIQPSETSKPETVFFADSFVPVKMIFSSSEDLQFYLNSCICYANTFSFSQKSDGNYTFSIGIFDSQNNLIQIGSQVTRNYNSQSFTGNISPSIAPNLDYLDQDSTYYVKPIVTKSGSSQYSNIRTIGGENDYYKLTIKNGNYYLTDKDEQIFNESGINYMILDKDLKTVIVTKGLYSGDLVIPSHVTYNNIEYTITEIEKKAFMQCFDLKSITLPSSLKKIGEWAFDGCSSLRKIVCFAKEPPECVFYLTYPFDDVIHSSVLFVLYGSKNDYLQSDGWRGFDIIEEMEENYSAVHDVNCSESYYNMYSVSGIYIGKTNNPNSNKNIFNGRHGLGIINGKKYLIINK